MYTDLSAALTEIKTNPATRGLIGTEYDAYLTNLLNLSAGKTSEGVIHFRPFYVAAKLLEQLRSQQQISAADGAQFTGLALPIASLLSLQAAYDLAMGLEVPAGFEAAVPSAQSAPQRYKTQTISTRARP